MRIKFAKTMLNAVSAGLLMAMLSGCAGNVPAQDGGLVQNQVPGDGKTVQNQALGDGGTIQNQALGDGGTVQNQTPEGGGLVQNQAPGDGGLGQGQTLGESGARNGMSSGDTSPDPGTAGDGGSGSSGKPQSGTGGMGDVYQIEDLYTREENILPVTQSASAGGISYQIENVEYTKSFGDRNRENLSLFSPAADTDNQGTLPEGFEYLFLTITFTNITDKPQEIIRTGNEISVIGDSLVTIPWNADACYYDTDWEQGTESEKHHWVLEPGAEVTSEIGWVIESCSRLLEADPTLESRMGSPGPYKLYYHVKEYDGDNENSFFIDLDVKVE